MTRDSRQKNPGPVFVVTLIMAQAQPAQQLHQPAPRSAFYPPYTQGQGQDQLLDPALDLANDLRLVYQHNSYQDRLARATRHLYDQVRTHRS